MWILVWLACSGPSEAPTPPAPPPPAPEPPVVPAVTPLKTPWDEAVSTRRFSVLGLDAGRRFAAFEHVYAPAPPSCPPPEGAPAPVDCGYPGLPAGAGRVQGVWDLEAGDVAGWRITEYPAASAADCMPAEQSAQRHAEVDDLWKAAGIDVAHPPSAVAAADGSLKIGAATVTVTSGRVPDGDPAVVAWCKDVAHCANGGLVRATARVGDRVLYQRDRPEYRGQGRTGELTFPSAAVDGPFVVFTERLRTIPPEGDCEPVREDWSLSPRLVVPESVAK